ncbi:UDP-N-acetylmuramoyl-tripeptide--D-alanyl-D-alanine ligase, partial [Streptococcus pneumoniae]|nr:UDP-N-acetylmuramoyl-tripeptide--D-alanyl-D-alanine ligase [Streptococcus pneumoniae]
DHLGDIHLLSELARPKTAIVTLVGEAHLAFFKDRSEIAKGKMQIADGMASGSLLLAPADPIVEDYLPTDKKVVRFGQGVELEITDLVERKDSLTFKANFLEQVLDLPVTGKYNATNAMIASYVALQEGVSEEQIRLAFQDLELTRNRTEWKKAANGADILSDVYNANPTAMKLILETFSAIPANEGGKKIAVLADMKELGDQSVQLHNQMILSLSPDVLDIVIFYGEDIAELAQLASQMFPIGHVYYFKKTEDQDQFEDLVKQVKESLSANDQILLKGSNSMNLAMLVESLENETK